MSRIGSIGTLSTNQLQAINRLTEIGQAIAQNQKRLSTLRRINSAKDDPSGLVRATLLETELKAAEQASSSVTRASALVSTADATAGEILKQLTSARTLVIASADGTLSSDAIAGNQIQIDLILAAVDKLAGTEFDGHRLLDGSSGFRTSGVDNTKIVDVDVLDKSTAEDVTVSINVTQQATQRTDQYSSGALGSDTTLTVEGPDGTTTIQLSSGADTQAITDAFNAVTYLTGITATRVDGTDVDFTTVDFGSKAAISITVTAGSFTTATTQAGTDAIATIDGQQVTGNGTTFNVNENNLALVIEIDPTASGVIAPFTVSGEGLDFVVSSSVGSNVRIGLANLHTSSLGGVSGKLSSLRSGGANTLTGGKTAEALNILDDAIADVTRSQAAIGGFQKFTLDSASRVLGSQIVNLSSALSAVRDTDIALETALLSNNQLLAQSTLLSLSITNFQNQDVLNLLKSAATRF
jgi:flagellin